MNPWLWIEIGAIIITLDAFAFLGGLAVLVDRRLIESDRRWRFSLGSLLFSGTLVALNGALIGIVLRR